MDEDRLRWITKPATLDYWTMQVTFSDVPGACVATVFVAGHCRRKRGAIWTHTETIECEGGRYSLHDLISHLSLAIEQDRPTTDRALTRAMVGEAWEQPELPW